MSHRFDSVHVQCRIAGQYSRELPSCVPRAVRGLPR